MLNLFKTNPGLLIVTVLLVFAAVVCLGIGWMMRHQGGSVRPMLWFMGFMLMIAGPQFVFHMRSALATAKIAEPRVAALRTLGQPRDDVTAEARTVAAKTLFGLDADADLIQDARPMHGDVLAEADPAVFAVLPEGETALIACFSGAGAAEKAWVEYLRIAGLTQTAKGDSTRGCSASRPAGDRLYARPEGRMLMIWTGRDDGTIIRRMRAGSFDVPSLAPLDFTGVAPSPRTGPHPALIAAAFPPYLLLVALYFFKGAAWAGSTTAKQGVAPVSEAELRARLEAVNALDVPFTVSRGAGEHQLIAEWRYADAKWVDLARAHGLKRAHRIVLTMDANSSVVRVTDSHAVCDWSAGMDGANLQWRTELGIVFFQMERGRVFGLQFDEHGRPTPELSYAYAFNLQEMKQPLLEAVAGAGWTWRPTVWQGPAWLRWLTE